MRAGPIDVKPMEKSKIHLLLDGTPLHYCLWRAERRSRGMIVLLHGMASNLTRWSEFLEHTALKNEWDILRPDLRGHGESMLRGKIGMQIWADDLINLLDAEGAERAVLVGHSLGAHLALHFAARYPARTRGIVMIDPVFPQALHGYRRLLSRVWPLLSLAAAAVRLLNALGLRRRAFPRRDLRVLDEQVRVELLEAGNAKEFVRRYSSPLADMKYFPVSHYIQEMAEMLRPLPAPSRVAVPMLVLLSRGLTYTDPIATARLLAEAPDAVCETIDAYHWPLTERPAEVRRAIETWIGERLSAR